MTATAPTLAPAALDWHGADAEPTDGLLDSLVGILWAEADRRLAEQAAAGRADGDEHQRKDEG